MNTSIKYFHVIVCKSKYLGLSFSGSFLLTNLPAFNNAAVDIQCAKTDDGAAYVQRLQHFRSFNWHWHCSLFSKNLTRNTFPLSITSIRIQDTTRKQFTSQNIARISSHKISSIRRFVLFHSATMNRSHPFVQPNLPKQYVIVFGSSSFSSNLLLKLLPLT